MTLHTRDLLLPLTLALTLSAPQVALAQGEPASAPPPSEGAAGAEASSPAGGSAGARTPAAEPPAPSEQTPAAPAPEPAASEPAAPAAGSASAPASAPEAAAEEDASIPGWFRIDHDSLMLQLWVGATHSVGPIDLATDIYVDSGTFAEFDIGPAFSLGPVSLLPMVGIGLDWSEQRSVTLVAPQLFSIVDVDPIYFESWIQVFLNDASPVTQAGGDNDLYTRNFLLLKATDDVHVGPQMEATIALNNDRDSLASLPVGGRLNLAYGENNTLGLFLGYETQADARAVDTGDFEVDASGVPVLDPNTGEPVPVTRERGLVGRFTFIRTW